MPGTVLGTGERAVNTTDQNPTPRKSPSRECFPVRLFSGHPVIHNDWALGSFHARLNSFSLRSGPSLNPIGGDKGKAAWLTSPAPLPWLTSPAPPAPAPPALASFPVEVEGGQSWGRGGLAATRGRCCEGRHISSASHPAPTPEGLRLCCLRNSKSQPLFQMKVDSDEKDGCLQGH